MSISPEPQPFSRDGRPPGASGFRLKAAGTIMLVIAALTAVAVFVAQEHARRANGQALEERFQRETLALLGVREARLAAITERCRLLARSVRIRAALEEDDVEDLYRNALDELRGTLRPAAAPGAGPPPPPRSAHPPEAPPSPATGPLLRADFFGFLNEAGALLHPPEGLLTASDGGNALARGGLAACEQQFARSAARRQIGAQETGYLSVEDPAGDGRALAEVVATPIIDPLTGKRIGALVLGFRPIEFDGEADAAAGGPCNGLWLEDMVSLPAVGEADRAALAARLAAKTRRGASGENHFPVTLAGSPFLLFFQPLKADALFAQAHGLCLYPLADSLRQERALRWGIIGWGGLALAGGGALSLLAARNLSAPVERLAEGAVENFDGRQRAEAELRLSNAQLQRALEELQAAQQQVIQQERLRALGEMASGIAHDFNNALMPILGFSELLLRVPGALENRQKVVGHLETINRCARDAGHVVGRLREFYRPKEDSERFAAVGLETLCAQVADLTRPKWKDQAQSNGVTVDLRTDVPPPGTLPPVTGSESDLREGLTNLVFNAVDAMPAGGTITLAARREGAWGVLEVRDTGTGMTEETRRRCLEPFFSTKGERGTGLGLAMVYGIIQRHQGTLEIDSQPGVGSTFRVRLPLHAPGGDVAAAEVPRPNLGDSLHVLVVDDEPQVREILLGYLGSEGHRVEAVANGREGLERLHAAPFDLVITDQAMPGMSGEQFAGAVKRLDPSMPVVLLTGFGVFLEGGAPPPGVDVVAGKPITLSVLRESIASARASQELVASP